MDEVPRQWFRDGRNCRVLTIEVPADMLVCQVGDRVGIGEAATVYRIERIVPVGDGPKRCAIYLRPTPL